MQLHKLPVSKADHPYLGIQGVELDVPLDVDRTLAKLNRVSMRHDVTLQIVDARNICGAKHIFHAATLALTAHEERNSRAKKIELEILLYLSGKRQIGEAIQSMGVKNVTREVTIIALGSSEKATRSALQDAVASLNGRTDDSALELTERKRARLQDMYDISGEELKLVTRNENWKEGLLKCVLERAAMLDALKK